MWAGGYALEIISSSFAAKLFWLNVKFAGMAAVPVAWFVFSLTFTGRDKWVTTQTVALLSIIPVIAWLLSVTNPLHGWFWQDMAISPAVPFPRLDYIPGPGRLFYVIYVYGVVGAGAYLIVKDLLSVGRAHRRQLWAIMMVVLIPWLGSLLDYLGIKTVTGFNITPLAFNLMILMVSWQFMRLQGYDILSGMWATVITKMEDGVIVLNQNRRVIKLNLSAESILNISDKRAFNLPIDTICPELTPLLPVTPSANTQHLDLRLNWPGGKQEYDVSLSTLTGLRGRIVGRVVVLRDITQRVQHKRLLQLTIQKMERRALLRNARLRATNKQLQQELAERQRVEAQLRMSEERYRQAVDNSPNPIFSINRHGLILTWNRACTDIFQRGPEVVDSASLPDLGLSLQQQHTTLAQLLADVFDRGASFSNIEIAFSGPDHTSRTLVSRLYPTFDREGQVQACVFASTDITARKMAEQQLQDSKSYLEQRVTERTAELLSVNQNLRASEDRYRRLLRETENALAETKALYEVIQAVTHLDDLPKLLQSITHTTAEVLEASTSFLIILDVEKQAITQLVGGGPVALPITGIDYHELMEGLTGWAIRHGKPILSPGGMPDSRESHRVRGRRLEHQTGSIMVAPLTFRGETRGTLTTLKKLGAPDFTRRELNLLAAMASQAAAAIEIARLYQLELERLRLSETLRQASLALTQSLSLDSTLNRILEELEHVVLYDSASVLLQKDDHQVIMSGRGFKNPEAIIGLKFPVPGNNPNSMVARQRQPIILSNAKKLHPPFRHAPHDHINSWLGVPLIVRDQLIGILALDSETPNYFTEAHIQSVMPFAYQAAIAIENARLFEQTRQEIEERKRAEDALRQSELKYRLLIEQIPAVTYIAAKDDISGTIFCSPQIEALTGYSAEEWMSTPNLWLERVHPEDRDHVMATIRESLQTLAPFRCKYRLFARDNSVLWVEDFASMVPNDSGQPVLQQGVMLDVTAQQEAEAQLAASLKEKEILLKEIHHRVKNNMQIISSLLNLQLQQVDDSETRNLLKDSHNRIRTMALVHEKLYQSRSFSQVSLKNYVQELVTYIFQSSRAVIRNVRLEINGNDCSIGADQLICCGLIINELVTNALKYAFPGGNGGKLTITIAALPTNITLTVADNGIGLADDINPANADTLGLQLVHALTDQLDGSATLHNDHGLVATINFPRQ
ncbi:MAG: hypothetical protein Kow0031_16570 [Anaerolineae bacterium]